MINGSRASEKRIGVILAFIGIWVLAIGVRLVRLQVIQSDQMKERAERNQKFSVPLSPIRGVIYDRNGHELARSVEVKSLYASPSLVSGQAAAESAADRLSGILDIDRDTIYRRLTSTQVLVAIKRKLSEKEASEVEKLSLPFLRFVDEMKRFYVNGSTASHVLGMVDMDDRGANGVELTLDKYIQGQAGKLLLNVDAFKNPYDHSMDEAVPGADVQLTIDTLIQHDAERALAEAVSESHAKGGSIVVLRPVTGEVLAMANCPSYDPNQFSHTTDEQRRNRAIETAFEPGSIFKVVAYSAAIEEGLIHSDSRIDCGHGSINIAGRIVHDHNPYGILTAAEALAKSSNVGAIKVGMMVGKERLSRYISNFGFGHTTGIELPGESRGLVHDASRWQPTTMGSIPMGHEVSVTALQAASAYGCIANDGVWVQPFLVSRVSKADGQILKEHESETRRVISSQTASTIKQMLEGVVISGTGKRAQMSGYRAAGKTGTAQKVEEGTHRYSSSSYVASFAGFAPVDNPEVVCIVSIDDPKGSHYGGDVAAPVFARVVSRALQVLGVEPEDNPQSRLVAADFRVYDIPRALVDSSIDVSVSESETPKSSGNGSEPGPARRQGSGVEVPDLIGRGLREAISLCSERGLKIKATGDGVITRQSPPAGLAVDPGTTCIVILSKQTTGKDGASQPRAAGR